MSTFDLFFLGYVHSDFGIVFDSKKKKKKKEKDFGIVYVGISMLSHLLD